MVTYRRIAHTGYIPYTDQSVTRGRDEHLVRGDGQAVDLFLEDSAAFHVHNHHDSSNIKHIGYSSERKSRKGRDEGQSWEFLEDVYL